MSFFKKIIGFFYKILPINPLKVILIGEKDALSELDKIVEKKLHDFNKNIQICKIVNFSKETEDYKRYPASIALAGRGTLLATRDLATAKIVVDFRLSKKYPKHNREKIYISIPGDEIFNEDFVKNFKLENYQQSLDFCIARNDRYAQKLQKLFANRVQVLSYGDPRIALTAGHTNNTKTATKELDRFVKLLLLILTARDSKYYDLFRRLNIKKERYIFLGIWHGYFGLTYLIANKLLKRYARTRIINPMKVKFRSIYKKLFEYLPVKNNRIVLRNFQHKYGDNPKYITEEMLTRNNKYDIVWIVDLKKSARSNYPNQIKIYQNNSFWGWYNLYTAKVWVDNNIRTVNPVKKDKQFYIQTWHGSLGIKKFDSVWAPHVIEENNRTTDICISNSKFETDVYKTTAWEKVLVEEYGHPRNDIIFWGEDKRSELKQKILSSFDLPLNAQIILYAPTFRDEHLYGSGEKKQDFSMYLCDYDAILAAATKRFGGEWFVLERMHYHVKSNSKKLNDNDNDHVIDVSSYNDMQELIFISDIGITDYSSWIYDFALTYRPGFIFAVDEAQYLAEREFYFDLRTTPFSVSTSTKELVGNIMGFEEPVFRSMMDEFLEGKGCIEDGAASSRVVDVIDRVILSGQKNEKK